MTIEINPGFRRALDIMEGTDLNVFITGKAGTGKSTLLELWRSQTLKRIAVLAPTGVAALNVRGQTVHSFFGFKPDITPDAGRELDIVYLKPDDTKSRRRIRPESVEMMEYHGKTFEAVRAYCHKRSECRTFRLDRMLEVIEV